jgi:hypothetical protein
MDKRIFFIVCISLVILQMGLVSPAVSKTFNFTATWEGDESLYASHCQSANSLAPSNPPNEFPPACISGYLDDTSDWNLDFDNTSNVEFNVGLDKEGYSYFIFNVSDYSDIANFTFSWNGEMEGSVKIGAYLYIWNSSSSDWVKIDYDSGNAFGEFDLEGNVTDADNFINEGNVTFLIVDTNGNGFTWKTDYVQLEMFYTISPPSVDINQPTDGQYLDSGTLVDLNVTATGSSIANCSLYLNSTGSWTLNQTNSSNILSGTEYRFQQNFSEGNYLFGFVCSSEDGQINTTSNYTFIVDETLPTIEITDTTTTKGLQTFSFTNTISDSHLNSCKYSLYDSVGLIDGTNENITFTCNALTEATATAYGTFTLKIYAEDLAGNENQTQENVTLEINVGSGDAGGGGGSSVSTTGLDLAKNFSITTLNLQNKMDISLAKDSKKPREKTFFITNGGLDSLDVEIACSTDEANLSSQDINICDYVSFSQTEFTVSPNQENPTIGRVQVLTPENASLGEKYYFNIIAMSNEGGTESYSKLSVSTRLSIFALLYKWSYLSKPEQSVVGDGLEPGKKVYPVWVLAIIFSMILSIGVFIGGNKLFADSGKTSLGAFFLSTAIFLVSFFLFIYWL